MLLSLYEVLVTQCFKHGIVIKQDIAGRELYLQFEKGKDYFDYATQHTIGEDTLIHPVEGLYYDITFEVSSTFWAKGQKYFTNAVLISIELS